MIYTYINVHEYKYVLWDVSGISYDSLFSSGNSILQSFPTVSVTWNSSYIYPDPDTHTWQTLPPDEKLDTYMLVVNSHLACMCVSQKLYDLSHNNIVIANTTAVCRTVQTHACVLLLSRGMQQRSVGETSSLRHTITMFSSLTFSLITIVPCISPSLVYSWDWFDG